MHLAQSYCSLVQAALLFEKIRFCRLIFLYFFGTKSGKNCCSHYLFCVNYQLEYTTESSPLFNYYTIRYLRSQLICHHHSEIKNFPVLSL